MPRISTNIILLVVMFSPLTLSITAQQPNRFTVALKIDEDSEQFSGQLIASRKHGSELSYTSPAGKGLGEVPGGVLVRIEQINNPTLAYKISIDSEGDRNVDNDEPQVIMPNSSIIVRVNRTWPGGRQQTLPYTIKFSREEDQNHQVRELFAWIPHYRAEGRLKTRSCETLLTVLDLTSDGQFDSEDFYRGTSIGLDRNGDGRIWGKEEYLRGEQIIEHCGEAFLIDGVAVDGTSVTFVKTALRVPNVGAQLPAFWLTTVNGKRIDSRSLRKNLHLLDFWASWCRPCVEKFSEVKRLNKEFSSLSIIAINVDEEARLPLARQIIEDYRLQWPQVMSGKGEADPVWKMFGTIGDNRLAIPLYALVDAEGRLRYAGNGGEGLSDLRATVKRLLKKSEKIRQ
jgi:thiol-disulfide isomerase/thioredoxin